MPSFTSKLLEEGIAEDYGEDTIKHITSSLYGGGADTVCCALFHFHSNFLLVISFDTYRLPSQ